uniref:Uncharacterized protein n=1 Tax=Kalanchoe fedtschenkoi TaxID=63787 RepID=A0A7N0ZSF7_KALFE
MFLRDLQFNLSSMYDFAEVMNISLFQSSGQQFGVDDFIPPYLAPTTSGPVVLKGVNYASGGAGILNHTGYIFIKTIKWMASSTTLQTQGKT